MNIDGHKMPFYKSRSGTDGKTKGGWFPFFGQGKGSKGSEWLIKGSIEDMENGYNIPSIQRARRLLNEAFPWQNSGSAPFRFYDRHARKHKWFGADVLSARDINKIFGSDTEVLGVTNGVNAQKHINDFLRKFKHNQKKDGGQINYQHLRK